MSAQHTPGPHTTKTPEYWLTLAHSERAFAEQDRRRRFGSVESIRIHLENAERYEAQAAAIAKATGSAA